MPQPFDRQWLTVPQQSAWRLLLLVMSHLPSDMNRQLQADSGISFQDFDVLVHLQEAPHHRLRLRDLAEALGWERSRTSHHVARMEARGMLERTRVSGDGRGAWVVATSDGLDSLERAAERHIALVHDLLFRGLDERDVTDLERVLTRIVVNMGMRPRTMWHVEPAADEPADDRYDAFAEHTGASA